MGRKFNPGGIKIEGRDDYVDKVYDILDQQINRNPAGKIILDYIEDNPHYIWIETHGTQCNSTARADDPIDSHPEDELYYERISTFDRDPNKMFRKSSKPGTGAGSDVHIKFSPDIWGTDNCYPQMLYGAKPDAVLFHELVHALRENQGLENSVPMPKTDFQDQEEFLAMIVANVYMSAKCKCETGLREGNHMTFSELKYPLARSTVVQSPPPLSVAFLADPDYREAMKTLWYWPPLYTGISWIPEADAPFNPFREFTQNMAKYMLLKPDFDYIAQYNHLVADLEKLVKDLRSPSLSPSEKTKLTAEKTDLEGKIKRWPDSDNRSP
jgi:hypothetical protein